MDRFRKTKFPEVKTCLHGSVAAHPYLYTFAAAGWYPDPVSLLRVGDSVSPTRVYKFSVHPWWASKGVCKMALAFAGESLLIVAAGKQVGVFDIRNVFGSYATPAADAAVRHLVCIPVDDDSKVVTVCGRPTSSAAQPATWVLATKTNTGSFFFSLYAGERCMRRVPVLQYTNIYSIALARGKYEIVIAGFVRPPGRATATTYACVTLNRFPRTSRDALVEICRTADVQDDTDSSFLSFPGMCMVGNQVVCVTPKLAGEDAWMTAGMQAVVCFEFPPDGLGGRKGIVVPSEHLCAMFDSKTEEVHRLAMIPYVGNLAIISSHDKTVVSFQQTDDQVRFMAMSSMTMAWMGAVVRGVFRRQLHQQMRQQQMQMSDARCVPSHGSRKKRRLGVFENVR